MINFYVERQLNKKRGTKGEDRVYYIILLQGFVFSFYFVKGAFELFSSIMTDGHQYLVFPHAEIPRFDNNLQVYQRI